MMAADYRHIGGRENRLGRHYSRFSAFWPAPTLAGQSLALRKLCDAGSNRRSRAKKDGAPEHGDVDKVSAADRADVERSPEEPGVALAIVGGFGSRLGFRQIEQAADQRELGAAVRVGEEAEVADPAEAVRQDVQQETPDELADRQGHHLGTLRVPVVLPAEADLSVSQGDEPTVGNGDPVRVAAQILEHLLRPAERPLGIDDPFDLAQGPQMGGKGCRLDEPGQLSEEVEHPGIEGRLQPFQKQPAVKAGEHSDRQEETGPAGDPAAVGRHAAARYDAMDVWMVEEVLPPGVQ